ncbi:hypothetical protein D3C80_2123800 [compost metagenome]
MAKWKCGYLRPSFANVDRIAHPDRTKFKIYPVAFNRVRTYKINRANAADKPVLNSFEKVGSGWNAGAV